MAEGVARDELLGESRPSAYLANAAVCNICITSDLPVPRKVEAEARRVLRIKLIQSAAGEWETASMPLSARA